MGPRGVKPGVSVTDNERVDRQLIGRSHHACALAAAFVIALLLPSAGAVAGDEEPRYLRDIRRLAEAEVQEGRPQVTCRGKWVGEIEKSGFSELGCSRYQLAWDHPEASVEGRLHLMAFDGRVFAVGIKQELPTWNEADSVARRVRFSVPDSWNCEPIERHMVQCVAPPSFIAISSADDGANPRPTAAFLYVRDPALFEAYLASASATQTMPASPDPAAQ